MFMINNIILLENTIRDTGLTGEDAISAYLSQMSAWGELHQDYYPRFGYVDTYTLDESTERKWCKQKELRR